MRAVVWENAPHSPYAPATLIPVCGEEIKATDGDLMDV